MDKGNKSDLRLSIEEAMVDAARVSGAFAVDEAFAMHGAHGIDDLPQGSYEQVFSELMRLISN